MCWGFNPTEVRQHNIEVGPFSFAAAPGGCRVVNNLDVQCAADEAVGHPGWADARHRARHQPYTNFKTNNIHGYPTPKGYRPL